LKTATAAEKPDIYYRMADLSFRNQQCSKAIEYYKEYIKIGKVPDILVESHFNTAECYSKINNKGEAAAWRTKVIQVQQSLVPRLKGPGARFAAKVKLQNIEQLYSELTALKFPANTLKMKKVAEQKLEIVNKLNSGLAEIVKYDSPEEIVGALELLGRTNYHMNSALLGAPVPPEVTKDDATKQQYMAAVGEMAKPFMAKALESYRGAISSL
jgi:tetratricopeptide (TPR) repeat protein